MKLRDEVFKVLINTLNNYNYCILRNYELLPSYLNDIDILVENKKSEEILIKLVDNFHSIGVIYLFKVYFSCISAFFYDIQTAQFIHLDISEKIRWKIFEYLPVDKILTTRIRYNSFYIPHPFFEINELLLTRLIYTGKIKEVYKDKIFTLYKNLNGQIKFKDHYNILKEISLCNWEAIEKRVNRFRVKIIFDNILKPFQFIQNLSEFILRIFRRLINPPGLFIAFYGVDGSGKSTQIKLLCESLRGIYSNKFRLFHFRPNFIYKEPKNITVSNPHAQLMSNFFRSFVKLIYYVFIYNWGYITQVLPFIAKNGLVIFDRYYFDLLIDPKRYRINAPSWLIKSCGKFIPKPVINICLVANEEKIIARKPEIEIKELKRQQKKIKDIFKSKNDYIVRTDSDEFDTLNKIKKIVIENVSKKN